MKQAQDDFTVDLFGAPRPVGRPRKPHTLSGAQRMARYRKEEINRSEARKTRFNHLSDVSLARYMSDPDMDDTMRRDLWLEFGRRMGWK